MEKLELRMYGFVNYQLTGIQKGIQFGHAVVKFGQKIKNSGDLELIEKWNDWADNWQTFIILDGGTTNLDSTNLGTLNQYFKEIEEREIPCQDFKEPDLGNQMTSFVFLADERVFNRKKYPDFTGSWFNPFAKKNWIKQIGGEQNYLLREFLKNKKLAS
jgi:hypothetical protein